MNTTFARTLVLAVAAFTGTGAFAESPLAGSVDAPWASQRTRTEVQTEMFLAKAAPNVWSTTTNHAALAKSVATRAAVQAELQKALISGEFAALHHEDGNAPVAHAARLGVWASNTTAQAGAAHSL